MNMESFAAPLAEILKFSVLAPGRSLRWTVIANPIAGGFTIGSSWKRHRSTLLEAAEKAKANPQRIDAAPSETAKKLGGLLGAPPLGKLGLIPTGEGGDAMAFTESALREVSVLYRALKERSPRDSAEKDQDLPFYLIICAGGDGTSREVMEALFNAERALLEHIAVLRLPMGTGNDGADAWELKDALELLIAPTNIERQRALRLTTATPGKGPFFAFNILSVGLDAFVTHMTNKMKGGLPGDSYKLWVDIASLLYDRIYHVGPMDLRVFTGEAGPPTEFRDIPLLLAMGVSGHRSYGSHKMILPDDRNLCMVRQMSLLRKIALKGLFTTGAHVDKKESLLFNDVRRLEFRGEQRILAQTDGETALLLPEDFPAAIALTDPVIPVLKQKRSVL